MGLSPGHHSGTDGHEIPEAVPADEPIEKEAESIISPLIAAAIPPPPIPTIPPPPPAPSPTEAAATDCDPNADLDAW